VNIGSKFTLSVDVNKFNVLFRVRRRVWRYQRGNQNP